MNKGLNSGISGPNNGPRLHATRTAVVSLTTSTFTDIVMDGISQDNGGMSQLVKSTGDVLITKDGMYKIMTQAGFAANGTGIRISGVLITYASGITEQFADSSGPASAAAVTGVPANGSIYLHKGDRVKLRQWQNSGGALNTSGSYINVSWIGP